MSELSEEEIIDNIKFVLRDLTADRYNVNFVNSIKGLLDLYQKEKEKNKKLNEEREHIKSNLQVDLVRKGVYAQARGQIKQILDYYENNDKYLESY